MQVCVTLCVNRRGSHRNRRDPHMCTAHRVPQRWSDGCAWLPCTTHLPPCFCSQVDRQRRKQDNRARLQAAAPERAAVATQTTEEQSAELEVPGLPQGKARFVPLLRNNFPAGSNAPSFLHLCSVARTEVSQPSGRNSFYVYMFQTTFKTTSRL